MGCTSRSEILTDLGRLSDCYLPSFHAGHFLKRCSRLCWFCVAHTTFLRLRHTPFQLMETRCQSLLQASAHDRSGGCFLLGVGFSKMLRAYDNRLACVLGGSSCFILYTAYLDYGEHTHIMHHTHIHTPFPARPGRPRWEPRWPLPAKDTKGRKEKERQASSTSPALPPARTRPSGTPGNSRVASLHLSSANSESAHLPFAFSARSDSNE